ncbi:MAG: ATPase, T2SS/T4P/T4SS family, partial [Bdellovibrionales bacterium]|nr:ATPase, T2SS/T4P/T4SS family [Bdellovibrionales bacterium]
MSSSKGNMSNVAAEAVQNNLGPVQHLREDSTVSEILLNGPDEIFVERKGKLEKTDAKFRSEDDLVAAVNAIANSIGRRISEEEPRLDARLPDGSRIHAVLKPLASCGTIV